METIEIINEMNDRVLRQLLYEIREVQILCLIVDEATYVAHKEQLYMTIR